MSARWAALTVPRSWSWPTPRTATAGAGPRWGGRRSWRYWSRAGWWSPTAAWASPPICRLDPTALARWFAAVMATATPLLMTATGGLQSEPWGGTPCSTTWSPHERPCAARELHLVSFDSEDCTSFIFVQSMFSSFLFLSSVSSHGNITYEITDRFV